MAQNTYNQRYDFDRDWSQRDNTRINRNYNPGGYAQVNYDQDNERDHFNSASGRYNSQYGYDAYGQSKGYDRQQDIYGSTNYGNQYGDPYGNQRYNYSQDRNRDTYGRQEADYGQDRNWWDRTTDEVSSWFGDDDAERRRRADKMAGPHRGKGPRGYKRSDERILDDINERLSDDPYIDASEIDITVSSGEVILSGTVDSKEAKRRAEDIAEEVGGVANVENQIRVNRVTVAAANTTNANTENAEAPKRKKSGWL
jgi:osmotically-inducible protein OsmY